MRRSRATVEMLIEQHLAVVDGHGDDEAVDSGGGLHTFSRRGSLRHWLPRAIQRQNSQSYRNTTSQSYQEPCDAVSKPA